VQLDVSNRSTSPRWLPTDQRVTWRPLELNGSTGNFAHVLSHQKGHKKAFSKLAENGHVSPLSDSKQRSVNQLPYADIIAAASRQHGVDSALIAGVIESESNFDPTAVSRAGAKGLMQLMDATARGLGVSDPMDPTQNIMGGARLLRQLLDRYGGDVSLALAAYNAGPGAVSQYNGVPPYAETQRYIPRVLSAMHRYGGSADARAFRAMPQRSEPWR
jgi:hypothetical protein